MATQRYYDDVLASLVERVNYIERRVSNSETADTSFGLTHAGLAGLGADDHTQYHNDTRGDIRYYTKAQAAAYTGTPTASTFAVWTAAGTLAGTTLNTSSFVIAEGVAGGQQVAGDTAISGSLHIYGTHYSSGTGNPALTAIYFAPSRGLTPSLSTRMDHDGDWTFTRNVLVQGTATLEDVFVLDKIVHDGDTDTAIRFPSVDTFTIETAGTERARVDSSGLVGVNVSPAGAQLDVVSGDAGRHALRLKAAASPTADVIDVEDSSGSTLMALDGTGRLSSNYFRGQVNTVADDAVWDITVPTGINGGVVLVYTAAFASGNGLLSWRSGSGPYCNILAAGADVAASTSVLTGTTGTDGKITVSATGGHIYIENRSGSSQTIRAAVFI